MMDREVRLTLEMAELPAWLRLLPLGEVELVDGRPPFEVDPEALEEMVGAFQGRGTDLVVDYEHQSLKGVQAPAAGWIKNLEAREDGLWARVEWTGQAQEYLDRREYRYFSPVLRLDPASRRPQELMNVALTNVPAIRGCSPLVAKWGGEALMAATQPGEAPVRALSQEASVLSACRERAGLVEEMRVRLGLSPEAEETVVWQRMVDLFRNLAVQLDLPAGAGASQVEGGLEALKAHEGEVAALKEELEALRERVEEETAARAVEKAMLAGKISPAQKSWALSYCRQDLESFKAYVEKAPKVVPVGERLHLGEDEGERGGLSPEELALCRAMNLTPEAYLQAKAGMGQAK